MRLRSSLKHYLACQARAFGKARGGNVSMIFGLSLVPLVGAVGLGIDYNVAIGDKAKLDVAADAAAIAGANAAKTYLQDHGNEPNTVAAAITFGRARAKAAFASSSSNIPYATVYMDTPQIVHSGQTFTSNVSYSATVQNNFGQIFGSKQIAINGTANASGTVTASSSSNSSTQTAHNSHPPAHSSFFHHSYDHSFYDHH